MVLCDTAAGAPFAVAPDPKLIPNKGAGTGTAKATGTTTESEIKSGSDNMVERRF